jgi:hypothetical protein
MSNVGACQYQILKSACKAPILGGIPNKRTIISRELATSVNGSRTRVAIEHASSVEKVDGVLTLREQHA